MIYGIQKCSGGNNYNTLFVVSNVTIAERCLRYLNRVHEGLFRYVILEEPLSEEDIDFFMERFK